MGWKGDLLVKTRYARAQEENVQLRAELDKLRDTVMRLTSELEEITLERNRINRGVARRQNRAVFNLPRPVDDSRLREMALATAAQFGHTGDGVTARARSYLDFLKGDAEPNQPTLADGEGVFE